jgi:hypothetical protein
MNAKELRAYRVQLFRDAANFRRPDRIPYFANNVTWKVFDAGHTLGEALTDYGVMRECVVHFLDSYPVDNLMDVGIRNQFGVTEAFGPGSYYYHDDSVVGVRDHAHCTVETLDEYLENPEKFTWEKILPAKYGDDWYRKDRAVWKKTFSEYLKYIRYIISMSSLTSKKYGLPGLAPNNPMTGAIDFAVEEMEANLLGIRQLSIAMRRSPEQLDRFIEAWDAQRIGPQIEKVRASRGPDYKYCFDASILMLAHNIMNPGQFERFYWPHLKELLDAYAEKGMNVRIFMEGSISRLTEYFAGYPKGVLTFHLENDDPFEIREKLPNVAIMGGLTTELMANGTPEEVTARARALCDGLGRDGGFILSEGKMVSYRNDARSENIKAVCDFVRSTGKGERA